MSNNLKNFFLAKLSQSPYPDMQSVGTPLSVLNTIDDLSVGVDLGITMLVTLSNGEKYAGPKTHTMLVKQLR